MNRQVYYAGILREEWDDSTRTYRAWDESGAPIEERPYTPEENAEADAAQAAADAKAVQAELDADLEQAVADLQVLIDTPNQTIANAPAPYIKDLAHILKKVCRSITKSFDSAE